MTGRQPTGRGAGPAGLRVAAGVLLAATAAAGAKPAAQRLKQYPTRYYVIHTDLDANAVQEASARLTAMAEEYRRRTRGFAGTIRSRFAFYLFSKKTAYHNAGATPGSAGVFDSQRQALLALAERGTDERLWHVIQHEGFHQFANTVIGGRLPIWIDEGMAEYFGHGAWTGDGFVTGLIPPHRLKRVQEHIRKDRLVPFLEMLRMSHQEWSDAVRDSAKDDEDDPSDEKRDGSDEDRSRGDKGVTSKPADDEVPRVRINYDQAWSMVHFLVHAEKGKYRKPLSNMIRDISRGRDWQRSFQARFGRNVKAFEKRYKDWWLAQTKSATEDLYIKIVVQTLTSFLGRAVAQGQKFATADEFFREARAGGLKSHKAQWLPPSLLEGKLLYARGWRRGWSLGATGRLPKLVLQWGSDKTFTGTFTHARGRCYNVKVTIAQTKP